MWVEIPYGKDKIKFQVDEDRVRTIITPSEISPSPNPELEIENALKNPIDGPTIEALSPRGKTVAIAVDDITRVTPTHIFLPIILRRLREAGAKKEHIRIVAALGTHRRMTDQEIKEKYTAEVVEEYEVINHDYDEESELKYMGHMLGDIPVWINKGYIEADIRIATGGLIPHGNAGWGAGAKILLPGLAGEETVGRMHVHSALTTPNGLGIVESPTRKWIDAFAEKVGLHLILNTAITRNHEIVKAFAGHFKKAHRLGVQFAKKIYCVEIPELADITISSSYPADIDFWQGEKGLYSADHATTKGGGIIDLTPCPEGVAAHHPKWIEYLEHNTKELKEIYEAGEVEDYVALGVAMNIAYVKEKHTIAIISDGITQSEVERMGFKKFKSVEEALEDFSKLYSPHSSINIITHGGDIYPTLK